MEFNLRYSPRRGNFIISKNEMKDCFNSFSNLIITFVNKKHIMKNCQDILFGIFYSDEVFRMHFYEMNNEEINDNLHGAFLEQIIPKIFEYLNNPNPKNGFHVKHKNGKLIINQD